MRIKLLGYRPIPILTAATLVWAMFFISPAIGQGIYSSSGVINAGTTIPVRTNETISTRNSDGEVYSGYVDQDVLGRNRAIVIPRGSPAELVVRRVGNNDVAVDLDSITVNGLRYSVDTDAAVVGSQQNGDFGANKRTGTFLGGGAALGAIIGAIAGGGKGAAIGAGAGAAAGAGAQFLTRGKSVNVPAESLLTFQLSEPIRAGIVDSGYMQNGHHYHRGYSNQQSVAYQQGLRDGHSDFDRHRAWNMQGYRSNSQQDRRDYEAGYNDGFNGYQYQGAYNRQKPGYSGYGNGAGTVTIGTDNNVSWQGPENSNVYVQMDNQPLQLFAHGQSGVQNAYWINPGHVYTFILKDASGNEIARNQVDMRNSRNRRR